MSSKKVSIIVPCYKVEKYLPRCLNSLVAQTLQDIEIICINDGSPDHCLDILNSFHKQYPDKIVVINKENEGVWRGRQDGIAIAQGEYIGFVDSDDYVEPIFAETLYTSAKQNNAVLVVGGYDRIDLDTNKRLSIEMCKQRKNFRIENDPGRLIELNGAPWNKLFKAEILKGMKDLNNPPAVLDDLIFHLLAYLDMKGVVAFTPTCLVHYMVRKDSIINTITLKKLCTGFDAFLETKQYYISCGKSISYIQALDAIAFLHLGISMMYRLSYNKEIDFKNVLHDCKTFLNRNFPSWKISPYISLAYTFRNRGAFIKLYIAQKIFKLNLMRPLLVLYRFMIEKVQVDIKW